ncbi:universal stress protein [Salinibaculum salinum]|uniref:universal stress protein n=1 Tax=Salinibaculum salinum TaxID=3131996 RepID=UPI0030EF7D67
MYRVLLPVDENEERAEQAAQNVINLPRDADDIEVVVLNVEAPYSVGDGGGRVSSEEFFDETDYPKSVEMVLDMLEDADIATKKRRVHGTPSEEILAVADEVDADAIAMSGRKRSPSGKVLFGSVTQSVLLDANRPVLVSAMG